jgi:hypothetical protein
MPLTYANGQEIREGDHVMYHGEKGEVELVAEPGSMDPKTQEYWYVQEHGGGVLIREPKVFGRIFLFAKQIAEGEDLVFVSRRASEPIHGTEGL